MSGADTPAKAALAEIDTLSINTIRTLAIDAVQKANSGHAGAPMALAPVAYTLWNRYLRYDPAHPHWPNRDRFVLSCGHASMLLYSLLHLAEVAEKDGGNAPAVSLEDIKKFRQLDSRTPGHPEYHFTTGVETTTGPLGQGVATAVGMAMAARRERGLLDPDAAPGESPFDHMVYVIASDGDLQEGVSAEASSLAGTQELGNLVVIWDDNDISIEDDTSIAFTEDVLARYAAYGWDTHHVAWKKSGEEYVEDIDAPADALAAATAEPPKPTVLALSTLRGGPSPG